jgi:hypothetical protein
VSSSLRYFGENLLRKWARYSVSLVSFADPVLSFLVGVSSVAPVHGHASSLHIWYVQCSDCWNLSRSKIKCLISFRK